MPTLGNHAVLRRVLDGYERQTAAVHRFEVIVVADREEPRIDAVTDAASGRSYRVRVLRGELPGASANRNAGWRAADAPIILFADSDTIPTRDLIAEHLRWHDRIPAAEVGVLGLVRWARGVEVTPFMRWLEYGVQFDYKSIPGTEASWAHFYSSNASVKRAMLERVGGYDDRRLPYGYEDLDWGYRAREHGLRLMFNRRAVVDHWRTMTIENWQTRAPRLAASEWEFCRLHPDVAPWFLNKFREAASHPHARGRAARLTRFVPRRTPWLGEWIWTRADLYWRQQIAPDFIAAWDAIAAGARPVVEPAAAVVAERGGQADAS